jgi:hypothetical protein
LIGFYEQSIPIEIALHEEGVGEEFAVESATLNEKALGLQDSNGNIWQKTCSITKIKCCYIYTLFFNISLMSLAWPLEGSIVIRDDPARKEVL